MKKTLIIISSVLVLILISITVYWNLPIEIARKSDIDSGNTIIRNIENYQKTNHQLPSDGDWQTLEKLGFKVEDLGTTPMYAKDSSNTYELSYPDGFDGPYLIWNSKERKWTIDFPTIFRE